MLQNSSSISRRVYDRSAIEAHFESNRRYGVTKSPFTNESIGQHLVPSPQIKSLIVKLIEKGVIEGPLKESWETQMNELKQRAELWKTANDGDPDATYKVYRGYRYGKFGFPEDHATAYSWLKKGHAVGEVKATAVLGVALIDGKLGKHPVVKNHAEGNLLLGMAAMTGSDVAALKIGVAYADGTSGLPVNREAAIKWLERGLSGGCPNIHSAEWLNKKAKASLEELTGE